MEGDVLTHSREAMRKGSLSFFLASRFLGAEARAAILMLYSWCRFCDDAIDRMPLGTPGEQKATVLDDLRRRTLDALRQKDDGEPVFRALAKVVRRRTIPDDLFMEFLEGMAMDIQRQRYETLPDLELYCFRVAGVVGLLFSYVVGVRDERALRHAVDLGIAMQMTNIARDVVEDAALGRVYLPAAWLSDEGIRTDEVALPRHRTKVARVAGRLLEAADAHYGSGDEGLQYLPVRAALAVAVARHVYAEIGVEVRARGENAWNSRTVVSLGRKLVLAVKAIGQMARGTIHRMRTPWRPATLTLVPRSWRTV